MGEAVRHPQQHPQDPYYRQVGELFPDWPRFENNRGLDGVIVGEYYPHVDRGDVAWAGEHERVCVTQLLLKVYSMV